MPKNVAVLCRVFGYKQGEWFPGSWYAVFDGRGNVFKGCPGDTAAAVQIRYCDSCGVPDDWDAIKTGLNPDQFDHTAGVAELLYFIAANRVQEPRPPRLRGSGTYPRKASA